MTPTDKPVLVFTVTANNLTDPPTAFCSPEMITVNVSNALVSFELTTPGFSFDPEGPITFNTSSPDFPDLWVTSNTLVSIRDRCTTPGDYPFTIHLVEDISQKRFSVDPYIKNGTT